MPDQTGSSEFEYVALGDSYSAGQFIGGDVNLVREPIDGPEGDYTGRSRSSYPQQLAGGLLSGWTVHDRTSGGATIDYRGLGVGGVLTPQVAFGGPPYIPMELDAETGQARPKFTPDPRRAQIEWVTRSTTLVTIGIGGNQYNLGQIVAKCAELGVSNLGSPGRDHYEGTLAGQEDLIQKELDLRDGLEKLMTELRDRAPDAAVFFVGYPTLFPRDEDDGLGTCDGGIDENLTIKKGDIPFIQGQFDRVNAIIRDIAGREGHRFVDLSESTRPHHVCRELDNKWMFGIFARYVFDAYRPEPFPPGAGMPPFSPGWTAWLQGLLGQGDLTLTTFHPNARGAVNQVAQVEAALRAAGVVPGA